MRIYIYVFIQCQLRNSIHIDKDFFQSWSWKNDIKYFEKEGIEDRTRCIFLILFTTVFIARRILSKLAVKIRRSNYRTMHIFHSFLPAIHAKHSCAMAADLTSNFLENIPNIWSSNVETDYVTRRIYLSNRSSRSSVHNLSQPRRNFSWRVAELLENRHYFKITQPNKFVKKSVATFSKTQLDKMNFLVEILFERVTVERCNTISLDWDIIAEGQNG